MVEIAVPYNKSYRVSALPSIWKEKPAAVGVDVNVAEQSALSQHFVSVFFTGLVNIKAGILLFVILVPHSKAGFKCTGTMAPERK